jgi:hypothetical protein
MREAEDTAVHSEARRWAAELLELSWPVEPGAVQTAFLKVLAEQDFAPDPDVAAAYAVLTKVGPEVGSEATPTALCWHTAVEQRLRRRIEQFLKTYFDQEPTQRAENWNELSDATEAFPALRQRLTRVRKGLAICRPSDELLDESPLGELAGLIERCYVATPVESARLRQTMRRTIRESSAEWGMAAYLLKLRCPELAALGEDLLEWVSRSAGSFVSESVPPPRPRNVLSLPKDVVQPHRPMSRRALSIIIWLACSAAIASMQFQSLQSKRAARETARETLERKQHKIWAMMHPDPIRHPALDASADHSPADSLHPANESEALPQRPEPPPLDLRFLEEISKPARWPPTSPPQR